MRDNNKNDRFFAKHFKRLVRDYGGQWIVIANGRKVGIGPKNQVAELLKQARKLKPSSVPLISPIPTESDIQCILQLWKK